MSHTIVDRRYSSILGPDGVPVASQMDLSPQAAWGGWEGAQTSRDVGWVYIPGLATSPEVDTLSRITLYDRISHLCRNGGLPKSILLNITRMVVSTGLMPEPLTNDAAYNTRVKQLWLERAEAPKTFSLTGRFSASSAQFALKFAQLKLGDSFQIAARDAGGFLRFAQYGGHQVGDGRDRPKNMRDGILLGPDNEMQGIRLIGRDIDNKPIQQDVAAAHVQQLCRYEGLEWTRGVTALAHAVNKLRSRVEIREALTKGIKMSSFQAWAIEQQLGSPPKPGGNLGPSAPRPTTVIEDPKSKKPILLEKFVEKGQIEELQPGQTLKILHDQRPHPNVAAFDDEEVRDICAGTGYSFEVLWKINELGGANTRFILDGTQGQINIDQEQLVEQVNAPTYIMLLQEWERLGLLPPCTDPQWWHHEWLTPPRLTVDYGRDGKIIIDQWHRGHITLKSIFGYRGENWQRQTDQWLDEILYRKEGMAKRGLTAADLPAQPAQSSIDQTPTDKPANP